MAVNVKPVFYSAIHLDADRHGNSRCVGQIGISRPRWREDYAIAAHRAAATAADCLQRLEPPERRDYLKLLAM